MSLSNDCFSRKRRIQRNRTKSYDLWTFGTCVSRFCPCMGMISGFRGGYKQYAAGSGSDFLFGNLFCGTHCNFVYYYWGVLLFDFCGRKGSCRKRKKNYYSHPDCWRDFARIDELSSRIARTGYSRI